jgi:hypothetical protein
MTHPIEQFRIKSVLEGRDLYFDTLKPQASSDIDLGLLSLVPCVIIELANSLASEHLPENQAQAIQKLNASAVVSDKEKIAVVNQNDPSDVIEVDCYVCRRETALATIEMAKALLPKGAYEHIKNHKLNFIFNLTKKVQSS